jgi:hypothetical protein
MADQKNSHDSDSVLGLGLGLAGAAFAGLLALATLTPVTASAKNAAQAFAISIPLSFAAYFAQNSLNSMKLSGKPKVIAYILFAILFNVAQIASIVGVFWLFDHINPPAAALFVKTAIICYFGVGVLVLIQMIRKGYQRTERRKATRANQHGSTALVVSPPIDPSSSSTRPTED